MAIAATPQAALSVVEGDTDFIGPQVPQTLDNVELTTDFPRVTLTTVVAPSPDWFVGVSANGQCDLPGNRDPTNAVPLPPSGRPPTLPPATSRSDSGTASGSLLACAPPADRSPTHYTANMSARSGSGGSRVSACETSIRAPSCRFSNPHQSRDRCRHRAVTSDGHRLGRAPLGVDQQLFSLGHDLLRPGADILHGLLARFVGEDEDDLHGLALADAPRAP